MLTQRHRQLQLQWAQDHRDYRESMEIDIVQKPLLCRIVSTLRSKGGPTRY